MLLLNELDRDQIVQVLSQIILPVAQSESVLIIIKHLKNLSTNVEDIKKESENV